MNTNCFESLILPAEFYESWLSVAIKSFVGAFFALIVLTITSHFIKFNFIHFYKIILAFPKLIISGIICLLIFCFDYETKSLCPPNLDNMLFTTYVVGFLALYELFTTLLSIVEDYINSVINNK